MKQIGNLAVVCARRQNVLLQVGSEKVSMNQVERAKMARIASSRRCTVITLTARHVG